MQRLAAFLTPTSSLESVQTHAAVAEVLGYNAIFDNHTANRDALATLVAYGQATRRVRLGTGVYPMLHMSPLALGQLAATIDELIDGRLILGIGTSHRFTIERWHGREFPKSPLTAMRETLHVLRSLFVNGDADFDGEYVSVERFAFNRFTPRPSIPIYMAALGPKMLELAGELADGVILWLCSPQYIAEVVVPHIEAGARRAGRDPADIEIVPAVTCSLTTDPEPAYDAFRKVLHLYLGLPFYRSMLQDAGFSDELASFDAGNQAGDREAALGSITTEMIDQLAAVGTARTIQHRLNQFREAGATLPGVGPMTAPGSAGVEEVLLAAGGDPIGKLDDALVGDGAADATTGQG